MWRTYVGDTVSGLLGAPIDIPSFSWEISVSDSSLSTTRSKGVGETDVSSLTIPWSAVRCQDDPVSRSEALAPTRRFVSLHWDSGENPSSPGTPWVWGAIGQRTDRWLDTSFSLDSPMELLSNRLLVRENTFGKASGNTTQDDIVFRGLSYRGIAAAIGTLATTQKPGGALPIRWNYLGESGTRQKTYHGYNVMNNDVKKLLDAITNLQNGPDMQFRPYLRDNTHVGLDFIAASDTDRYLAQDLQHTLLTFPGGGTLQNVEVEHVGPVMRVYGSGAGTDEAQLCAYAEDMTRVHQSADPWPLVETTYGGSDDDTIEALQSHVNATLEANKTPLMQVSGTVNFADPAVPDPGEWWPGEVITWRCEGYPTIPDGEYQMRIMKMSGNETTNVDILFDVMEDPVY